MPRVYAIFASFVFAGIVLGPFGTFETLSMSQRVGFSFITNAVCWLIGIAVTVPSRIYLEGKGIPRNVALLIACTLATAFICPSFVFILETELGQAVPVSRVIEDLALIWLVVIFLSFSLLARYSPQPAEAGLDAQASNAIPKTGPGAEENRPCHANPSACRLLARISPSKRGVLYALVAQDHYVEVVTSRGVELILMRLADAIESCDQEESLRIHRSAWVTRQGVREIKRCGRNMRAVLHNGREIAVARSSEKAVAAMFGRFCDHAELPVESSSVSASRA